MSQTPLRLVMCGCGAMSNGWMHAIRKLSDVDVVGLVDLHRPNAEKIADKFGIPHDRIFGSLTSALEAAKPQVVVDVTVPVAHEAVTTEALRAGCHVLGEKPLSTSIESAKRVVAEAGKSGRTYAVMQNRRYDANIIAFTDFIHAKLGGLNELHADMFIGAHFGGFRDLMDYPLLLDMAIHTFDAARFIAKADPVSVYCHSFNPKHSWYKGDASAICIFEFENGLVFSYRGSWCSEGLHADWNGEWRAIGKNGTAKWDGQTSLKAQTIVPGGKHEFHSQMQDETITPKPTEGSGHERLIFDFVDCLRTGRTPQTICTDNIKSLAMVEAAVNSAKRGQKVKVEW